MCCETALTKSVRRAETFAMTRRSAGLPTVPSNERASQPAQTVPGVRNPRRISDGDLSASHTCVCPVRREVA